MSDAADSLVAEATVRPTDDDTEAKQLWVCNFDSKDNPGTICGRSFDTKQQLNGHTVGVHRMTWEGKPTGKPGRKTEADETPTAKGKADKPAAKKATAKAPPNITNENRAQVYTQSLASIGLIAHLAAGRWFDNYDMDVWSRGTPGLANALDAVGEQNEGIRRACDLILSGGSGGAYVQLFMAATMIAVPIAAHHNFLPPATGERFAAMLGVISAPTVVPGPEGAQPAPQTPPGSGPSNRLPIDSWTYDDWREVLFAQTQNPVAAQATADMMAGMGIDMGAVQVTIPDMPGTQPMTIPEDDHRGSVGADQTAPDVEPVPAAT